ncbi:MULTISPECIES: YqgQ family protein [unclassified Bacillus (in: firmicutes)]|uniref:YqgQ family protein n=1 Tax=Bacillaceae TaxID=186817 RepID=UPI000BEFED65|nr:MULTISPECIES: YqgQ family protein [unclassified Bacillus (in: firmicutes)]PEJ56949.1 cytosolic protein [Bacillus sp. AFS002410]PEL11319.1 cytosolic protein [Bacillus sp. AFS017336]QKE71522.1 YqgQ family protein [Arthrobacter citreus]
MKSVYDIQQFLKNYGTFIYTGDRLADLMLMQDELKELFLANILDIKDLQVATLILKKEMDVIKNKTV